MQPGPATAAQVLTGGAPRTLPRSIAATGAVMSIPSLNASDQPLLAGFAGKLAANEVLRLVPAVCARAGGGQQAVATDWALDWDNEGREALVAQPKQARDAPAPAQAAPDGERPAVRILDALSEEAISNTTDMQLVFLGTSGRQPTRAR